jgi:putative SOS response-associated peptidase YedK
MCGRFTLHTSRSDLQLAFEGFVFTDEVEPRYNIAPTLDILVVANDGKREVRQARWGLIPGWAKDPRVGSRMINARSETLAQKPAFREAYRNRRCLVIADGFYEWRKEPEGGKTPIYIQLRDGRPFAFAGLWARWRPESGEPVTSCTIVTTAPNDLMATIHNRMPVILPPSAYDLWLGPDTDEPEVLNGLLVPFPQEDMVVRPVTQRVNSVRNEGAECIAVPPPARGNAQIGQLTLLLDDSIGGTS